MTDRVVTTPAEAHTTTASAPLVFVYNAESGLANAIIDIAHRACSPDSYPCQLCTLTWSPLRMRRRWKRFVAALGRPVEFLHSDEFASRYGIRDAELPAVFARTRDGVQPWIGAERIRACATLDDLEALVRARHEADR